MCQTTERTKIKEYGFVTQSNIVHDCVATMIAFHSDEYKHVFHTIALPSRMPMFNSFKCINFLTLLRMKK
jgi:hypothetical protein